MNRERETWFARTFAAGNNPMPSAESIARLRGKVIALEEILELARSLERTEATAGALRHVIELRANDSRALLEKLTRPLEADAEGTPHSARGADGLLSASASSGPSAGLTARPGAPDGPLDNLVELPIAMDAGEICPRCGNQVTWVDHLPPLQRGQSVRCFAAFIANRVPDPA